MPDDAGSVEERAAKGVLAGWWTAKTTAWSIRLKIWGMWLALLAGYVLYVWIRVRRMLKTQAEAADAPGGRPPTFTS